MVIYRHREKYSISGMRRFFDVSRSGYYDYVKRMDIPAKDLPLAEKIKECQDAETRMITQWLKISSLFSKPNVFTEQR